MAWLSEEEIKDVGFRSVGRSVRISKLASFHGADQISIGDFSRLDDFCVLSAGAGGISIGRYVHVGVFTSIIGAGKIAIGDFCDISGRVSIYGSNEDYSGATITPPTVPDQYRGVSHGDVTLNAHVIVASGSVILPNVTLGEGAAVGSLSLVKSDCEPFGVYVGVPVRLIKQRRRDLLALADELVASETPD